MLSMIGRLQEAKACRTGAATAANVPTPSLLTGPDDVALNSWMEECVLTLRNHSKCTNSIKAIDTKQEQCMQCCEKCFPNDLHKLMLDRHKAHRIVWRQTFGLQKPRGGKQKFLENNVFFDKDDHERMKAQAEAVGGNPEPTRPIRHSVFTQDKAMLWALCKVQSARRAIDLHWDAMWFEAFEDLEKHVKERTPWEKKETHEGKATSEFAPHAAAEHCKDTEEALWIGGHGGARQSPRFESLHGAELRDFLSLTVPKKDKDAHPMFLMVNP